MKIIIFILLLFVFINANAQIECVKKTAIAESEGYFSDYLYEFGENGVIFYSEKDQKVDDNKEYDFVFFDKDLKLVKTEKALIYKKLRKEISVKSETHLHTLFLDKDGNFTIVNASIKETILKNVSGVIDPKAKLRDAVVLGENIYIKSIIKEAPFIIKINWKTGKNSLIPIVIENQKPNEISIINIQAIEKSNEVFVFVRVPLNDNEVNTFAIKIDEKVLNIKYNFKNFTKNNISAISITNIGPDEYIFSGTYSKNNPIIGIRSDRPPRKTGVVSEGIFFAKGKNNKIEFIKFYNFTDLKDFFNHLTSKRKEKIETRKEKGKEINNRFFVESHNLIPTNKNEFIYLGEIFYPIFKEIIRSNNEIDYDLNGYQYAHSVIAKLNNQGDLIWDKNFSMWAIDKPQEIVKLIQTPEINDNNIKLIFLNSSSLILKGFNVDGSLLYDETDASSQLKNEDSKIEFSTNQKIYYWYKDYYLLYGYDRYNKKENKGKEMVSFIKKIKY